MYREPPLTCAICGKLVELSQSDVIESGLRCPRCTAAAELAAIAPTLAEVRAAQAAHRALAQATDEARRLRERGCSRHEQWDTYCFWCVLRRWLPADD
jgi:hypothetical protein